MKIVPATPPALDDGAMNTSHQGASADFIRSASALVELFERCFDREQDIAGWHGTSVEAIERALLLGNLSPSTQASLQQGCGGYVYYFPSNPSDFQPGARVGNVDAGLAGAVGYANSNAAYHFMLKEFGLSFDNPDHHRLVAAVHLAVPGATRIDRDLRERLAQHGISEIEAKSVANHAVTRQGVVIALAHQAIDSYPVSEGDIVGEDKRLYAPNGLAFSAIAGLEPLGDAEYRYFETLQTLVGAMKQGA